MTAGNDERRPGRDGASSSISSTAEFTAHPRQKPPTTHVIADAYLSMGFRGKPKLYLLVRHCSYCHSPHCHTGKPDFTAGARMASCGGGRYLVHVVSVEAGAAA